MLPNAVNGTLIYVLILLSEIYWNVSNVVVYNLLNLPTFVVVLTKPNYVLKLAEITVLVSLIEESRLIAIASSNLTEVVIVLKTADLTAPICSYVG